MTRRLGLGPLLAAALVGCQPLVTPDQQTRLALPAGHSEATGQLELHLGSPFKLQGLADLTSLELKVLRGNELLAERSVDSSATLAQQGRVSFTQLSVGAILVQVRALDAQGLTLGYAQAEGVITAGESTRLPIQLKVGAPSSSGNLGVDLSLHENEASAGARPYRMVAVANVPYILSGFTPPAGIPDFIPTLGKVLVHPNTGDVWLAMRKQGLIRFSPDLAASQPIFLGRIAKLIAPTPDGGVVVSDGIGGIWTVSSDGLASSTVSNTNPQMVVSLPDYPIRLFITTDHLGRILQLNRDNGELSGPALPTQGPSPGFWNLPTPLFRLPISATFIPDPQRSADGRRFFYVQPTPHQSEASQVCAFDLRGNAQVVANIRHSSGAPVQPGIQGSVVDNERVAQTGHWPGYGHRIASDARGGTLFLIASGGNANSMSLWRQGDSGSIVRVWGPALSPAEQAINLAEQARQGRTNYDVNFFPPMGVSTEGGVPYQGYCVEPEISAAKGKVAVMDLFTLRLLQEQ